MAVSNSGFYAWLKRERSVRQQENEALAVDIRQIYEDSRETYGSPRIHAKLQAKCQNMSRNRVARLMRMHGIQAKRKQRYKTTTKFDPAC
ncbi:MAG: hypothetical protein CL607_12310 [Anaerolineaceae bacterium]|nr:hypothetical protein [Anaerolineaceae bacterium]